MSMNVNGTTQQKGTEWFQNMKMQKPDRNAPEAQPPQADRAVNVTISREGLESLQNGGKARTYEGVVKQKESIMQASKSVGAGYGYRLSEEAGKLKGQRESGDVYSLSDRATDYVRVYGNLYDEIIQGYKDGTAEHYVEDGSSETGFRKMTLDEELAGLDRAFGRMADGAGVKEMISGEFKWLASKAGSRHTAFSDTNKKPQGTDVPQKLVTLAQAWKDAYKVSGSKEGGMEKVLSMLDGMFGIKNEV